MQEGGCVGRGATKTSVSRRGGTVGPAVGAALSGQSFERGTGGARSWSLPRDSASVAAAGVGYRVPGKARAGVFRMPPGARRASMGIAPQTSPLATVCRIADASRLASIDGATPMDQQTLGQAARQR